MHLEQCQTKLVRIFEHPLFRPVASLDDLFGADERSVEKHHLQPLVGDRKRLSPSGPECSILLAPAVDAAGRHAGFRRGQSDIAGLGKHGKKACFLLPAPLARLGLAHLRLLPAHQVQLPPHAPLPNDPTKRAGAVACPARPNPAGSDSQFFTVPTVYLLSVTMSRAISPIWLFLWRHRSAASCIWLCASR